MAEKNFYYDMNLNGGTITGIADGVNATDAATKGQLDAQDTALRAYVDAEILGLGSFVDELDPSLGLPTAGSGAAGAIDGGDWWYISAEGTLLGIPVHKGDRLQAMVDNPDTDDNTGTNTDWKVLHSYHEADSRFPITNLELTADTPETINHGLGYKFVHVTVADAAGDAVDVQVNYVDENNLTLTANTTVTVSGVVSI
jgi:hypothetical protein